MTTRHEAAAQIQSSRLLAIVRLDSAEASITACRTLGTAGINVMEISLSGVGALDAIKASRSTGALVGAGTVRTLSDAISAVEVGAQFLVSPAFDERISEWAQTHDILYVPGAFSPSEVDIASRAGALLIKLFPARALGPAHVRDLLGPFPEIKLVPTGGVDRSNAREYLEAGAAAVAVGGSLVAPAAVADPRVLRSAAEQLRREISLLPGG